MRKYSEYEKEQIRKKNDKHFWKWCCVFGAIDLFKFFTGGFD
jgi:hypothetical protein